MFTVSHFIWLAISVCVIFFFSVLMNKKDVSLEKVLSIACWVCIVSELVKIFATAIMVPSQDGSLVYPYLETNQLPLHMCSIQILAIFYVKYTKNKNLRDLVFAVMYPTCLVGSILALMMPSIFSTTIKVSEAFTSPIAYQFFLYHSMLFILALALLKKADIKAEYFKKTLIILAVLVFCSIYVNSALAHPVYANGKLISLEHMPNFFFSVKAPVNIVFKTKLQWMLYLLTISVVGIISIFLCYIPIFKKNAKAK